MWVWVCLTPSILTLRGFRVRPPGFESLRGNFTDAIGDLTLQKFVRNTPFPAQEGREGPSIAWEGGRQARKQGMNAKPFTPIFFE